jgi:hypothetical protein
MNLYNIYCLTGNIIKDFANLIENIYNHTIKYLESNNNKK